MAVTATLTGNVTLTDNVAGDTSLSKVLSLSYAGINSAFTQSQSLGLTPTLITLPASPVQFLYLRNLATASGATVTVTWTANGGSANPVLNLSPGSAILFSETDVLHGITSLSVTAALDATPIEYILVA